MELKQLGPYRIIRELGRGGMGTVYAGINVATGEPAAIKLLSAMLAQQEGFRDRFEVEIETLRKLKHPNIVRLFGFGEQDGHLFYAMEWVNGNSLEQELRLGRTFDWREVTQIGIETCRALRHAHDRGVIHRDIKPGNLLLAQDGHVKLSDFGIARLFGGTNLTQVGSVLGTAEYMAPEQAEGRPVGPRADLYSLGGVLYALLTRRPLFLAESLPEMLQKQRGERPDRASQHAPDVPAVLDQIIAQLLEKDPDRRIANATLLGRQLEVMQRTLSLGFETAEAPVTANDVAAPPDEAAGDPAAAESDDLAPSPAPPGERGASASPAVDNPQPPSAPPAPSADDLPETVATAAFQKPQEPEPPKEEPKPPSRFIPVPEEELDRIERVEPRPAWSWPQTWILAAALVAVGLTVWHFLQPPSADSLYKRIVAHTADGSAASLAEAEGPIDEFLMRFPADSRCKQLRQYQSEIDLYRLEQRFKLRAQGLAGTENLTPIEQDYLEAINYVWLDPQRGMAKLQALVDLYGHERDTSGPTGKCLELARRRLVQLHAQLDEQHAQHLSLLQARLDAADQLSPTDPQRARAIYQAVIDLYQEKPWADAAVRRARAALAAPSAGQRHLQDKKGAENEASGGNHSISKK